MGIYLLGIVAQTRAKSQQASTHGVLVQKHVASYSVRCSVPCDPHFKKFEN